MTTQTTKTYRITNTRSGHTLGDYQGATESEALDAMARDAGYENFEAACEVAPIKDGELLVTEVEADDARGCQYRIGDRVEAGEIVDDYDTGTIIDLNGAIAIVAWDSGVMTGTPVEMLRTEGERPVMDTAQ